MGSQLFTGGSLNSNSGIAGSLGSNSNSNSGSYISSNSGLSGSHLGGAGGVKNPDFSDAKFNSGYGQYSGSTTSNKHTFGSQNNVAANAESFANSGLTNPTTSNSGLSTSTSTGSTNSKNNGLHNLNVDAGSNYANHGFNNPNYATGSNLYNNGVSGSQSTNPANVQNSASLGVGSNANSGFPISGSYYGSTGNNFNNKESGLNFKPDSTKPSNFGTQVFESQTSHTANSGLPSNFELPSNSGLTSNFESTSNSGLLTNLGNYGSSTGLDKTNNFAVSHTGKKLIFIFHATNCFVIKVLLVGCLRILVVMGYFRLNLDFILN